MTTLDRAAIIEIERLTRESESIVLPPKTETRQLYYIRQGDGNLEMVDVPLTARNVRVYDLLSLRLAEGEAVADPAVVPLAYYVSDTKVTLECEANGGNHRWNVELELPTHPAFALVNSWANGAAYDHKELVRLLRTKLRGYVDASVVSQLENIRVSFAQESASTQTHAHSGLSSSTQKEVRLQNGQELLPDFLVEVPVYDIPEYRKAAYPVSVLVDYDHERKVFILTAVNDDLKEARETAVEGVRNDLKGDLSVYYGSI